MGNLSKAQSDSGSPGGSRSDSQQTSTLLMVQGMSCQNCVRHVRQALMSVKGVKSAEVSLENGSAIINWQTPPDADDVNALITAVKDAGYKAEIKTQDTEGDIEKHIELGKWQFNVIFGVAALLPLLIGEWVFGMSEKHWFQWFSFLLATPVQILCGWRFYSGAYQQLKYLKSNMDTLVALGSTAAFGYSVWGLFAGVKHLYFMEAIGIITLISIGHWLESRMSAKAGEALKRLMELAPSKAIALIDGKEVEVPIEQLRPGDFVVLKPGDRVPTDGSVVDGAGSVDESMLTGESMPIEKGAQSPVYAGTLVTDGRLLMKVQAVGEQTALANIISAVRRAQASQAQIQKLADKVSSVFVPIVVLIAIATGLWWGLAYDSALRFHHFLSAFLWHTAVPDTPIGAAFIQAAAVLIVACPCAMGLATPVAIMAGANVAARRGILIRDALALEKSGTITAVIFDKTGTLTEGKLRVAETFHPGLRKEFDEQLWDLTIKIASASNHPICKAITRAKTESRKHLQIANNNDLNVESREERGSGVEMKIKKTDNEHKTARLGSLKWFTELGIDTTKVEEFARKWQSRGATVIGIAIEKELLGAVALEDTIKQDARKVVSQLKAKGIKVYMITGDHPAVAAAIGKEVGIPEDKIFAGIKPEEKSNMVAELQRRGERAAFVGDGINDAPALEQADLGIAVSRASDIAREAADIILLKSDIHAIPEALNLAQATLRTIKQNLFWAFFYNIAAVPLAALGFLSPIVCAMAMGVSDIVVIGNALLLNRRARSGE